MGHNRTRPIVGQTAAGVGATYIVVDQACDDTRIQVIANGTVTFTVDYTNQNILHGAPTAVNIVQPNDADRYVAPASATWINGIASGSASAEDELRTPVFALRINITAGTGSVSYHINQA